MIGTLVVILFMVFIFGLVIGFTVLIKFAVAVLVIFVVGYTAGSVHQYKHLKKKYFFTKK
jgi:hypothetical protein